MAEAADQVQHDFWRPPVSASKVAEISERSAACAHCGTEFIVSSLYCHACGVSRPNLSASNHLEIPGLIELRSLAERLEMTMPTVIAFLAGIFCVVGALAVSMFFSARTLLDWQAIQLWRIEWLIGAVAAFVVGCLFKK